MVGVLNLAKAPGASRGLTCSLVQRVLLTFSASKAYSTACWLLRPDLTVARTAHTMPLPALLALADRLTKPADTSVSGKVVLVKSGVVWRVALTALVMVRA